MDGQISRTICQGNEKAGKHVTRSAVGNEKSTSVCYESKPVVVVIVGSVSSLVTIPQVHLVLPTSYWESLAALELRTVGTHSNDPRSRLG